MDFCSYKDMILNLSLPNEIIKALMILYDDRINKHWGPTSGPLWTFYSTLREILEQNASNQFGLVHSNVAKIANVAGEKINGVRSESKINTQLVKYLKKEIEIIDPYIVIFTIGKTKHYIKLMEQISPSIINQMCNCLSTSTPIIGPEVHYLEGREIFLSLIIRTV